MCDIGAACQTAEVGRYLLGGTQLDRVPARRLHSIDFKAGDGSRSETGARELQIGPPRITVVLLRQGLRAWPDLQWRASPESGLRVSPERGSRVSPERGHAHRQSRDDACHPLGGPACRHAKGPRTCPNLGGPLRYDEGDSRGPEEVADAGDLKVHERVYARATGAATEGATLVGTRGLQVWPSAGRSLSPTACTHYLVIGACRMAVGSVTRLSGAATRGGDRVKGHRLRGDRCDEIRRTAWRMLRSLFCPVGHLPGGR